MLSRQLRRILATVAIVLLAGILPFAAAGYLNPVLALGCGLGAFVILIACVTIATYALNRPFAYAPPDSLKVSSWTAFRSAVREGVATFVLFVLVQPFERLWMPPDSVEPPTHDRPTVLLIHGYFCNRGLWWWMRRRLGAQRLPVSTVNLEPPLVSIEDLANSLHARLCALQADADGDPVVLVGHSMGGLVARAYLRRYGVGRVTKLITLGTPHHGTELARYGGGRNAREMQPDSDWIRLLAESEPPPVPTLSIWSARDNFIAPQDSSRLADAREIVLPSIGHLSMVLSPAILDILLTEIAEPPSARPQTRNELPASAG